MSSRGELFITEDIRDTFRDELDAVFGKENWELEANDYCHLWDERLFPDVMIIIVSGLDKERIGRITVSIDFSIEGDTLCGRTIEVNVGELLSIEKF